jgi:hypothetical protein
MLEPSYFSKAIHRARGALDDGIMVGYSIIGEFFNNWLARKNKFFAMRAIKIFQGRSV